MKVNLSIVTVLYNHSQDVVDKYFESILDKVQYNQHIFNYNIYLIDNSDNGINISTPNDSIIHYIKNDNNGYCAGNNQGCLSAPDGHIIICNPDIILKDSLVIDWLYSMAVQYNCISGILRNGTNWLTFPAMFPTDQQYIPEELPFAYDFNPMQVMPEKNWKSLPYIDGSLMCFSRKIWEEVKFDESFFPGYFGENAFQYKATKLGYKLKHCPIEDMFIHESKSDDQYSLAQKKEWTKTSREHFYKEYALADYQYFINQLR